MQRRKEPYKLSQRSKERLVGVDPRLVALIHEALHYVDFSVIEGLRSEETQKTYLATGVSKTLKSKHLEGLAVDLYPWPCPKTRDGMIDSDSNAWNILAFYLGYCAGKLGLNITWGGTWKSLVDKPHFELED